MIDRILELACAVDGIPGDRFVHITIARGGPKAKPRFCAAVVEVDGNSEVDHAFGDTADLAVANLLQKLEERVLERRDEFVRISAAIPPRGPGGGT